MSINTPFDAMGYLAGPAPIQRISSSSRQDLQPPHPLKISTLPQMNAYDVPQHQPVADNTGNWEGPFHDVPAHPGWDHAANTNTNPRMGQDMSQASFSSNAHVSLHAQPLLTQGSGAGTGPQGHGGGADGMMLDDRWVSLMNYDMMHGEQSQYHHL